MPHRVSEKGGLVSDRSNPHCIFNGYRLRFWTVLWLNVCPNKKHQGKCSALRSLSLVWYKKSNGSKPEIYQFHAIPMIFHGPKAPRQFMGFAVDP